MYLSKFESNSQAALKTLQAVQFDFGLAAQKARPINSIGYDNNNTLK